MAYVRDSSRADVPTLDGVAFYLNEIFPCRATNCVGPFFDHLLTDNAGAGTLGLHLVQRSLATGIRIVGIIANIDEVLHSNHVIEVLALRRFDLQGIGVFEHAEVGIGTCTTAQRSAKRYNSQITHL
jgi:hypothetical protein